MMRQNHILQVTININDLDKKDAKNSTIKIYKVQNSNDYLLCLTRTDNVGFGGWGKHRN